MFVYAYHAKFSELDPRVARRRKVARLPKRDEEPDGARFVEGDPGVDAPSIR